MLVGSASGSSSLRRWHAPSRRAVHSALVELPVSAASRTSWGLRSSRSTNLHPRSITLDLQPSPPSYRQWRHTSSLSAVSAGLGTTSNHTHRRDGGGRYDRSDFSPSPPLSRWVCRAMAATSVVVIASVALAVAVAPLPLPRHCVGPGRGSTCLVALALGSVIIAPLPTAYIIQESKAR